MTIHQAFLYGISYIFLSEYPLPFQQARHWSDGVNGLPLLSLHVWILLSIGITVWYTLQVVAPKVVATDGKAVPEDRLPVVILWAFLFATNLF